MRIRVTLRTYGGDYRPPAVRGSVGVCAGWASRTRRSCPRPSPRSPRRPAAGQACRRRVALVACNFLAYVDALASRWHVGGGLDALRVPYAGARLGVAAFGFTHQAPQQAVEPIEDTFVLPGGEVAVGRLLRCEVVREVTPRDPGAVDVEDGVHDAAQIVLRRPADVQASERGADQLPAGIGQVAGIQALARHVSVVPSCPTHPQGANSVNRGRFGIRRERLNSNGQRYGVSCRTGRIHHSRLSRRRPAHRLKRHQTSSLGKTLFQLVL